MDYPGKQNSKLLVSERIVIRMGDGVGEIPGCNVGEFGCWGLKCLWNEVMGTVHVKRLAGV